MTPGARRTFRDPAKALVAGSFQTNDAPRLSFSHLTIPDIVQKHCSTEMMGKTINSSGSQCLHGTQHSPLHCATRLIIMTSSMYFRQDDCQINGGSLNSSNQPKATEITTTTNKIDKTYHNSKNATKSKVVPGHLILNISTTL